MTEREDPQTPGARFDEDDDDLVGPRRGASPRRRTVLDDGDAAGPRISAPRLRRAPREAGSRDTVVTLVRDIPNFIKLLARLVRDPRVSRLDKAILGAVLAYFVMPVDLIPDVAFPVLGQLDDIYFLALALSRLVNNAGIEVILDHWQGEERSLELLLAGLDRAAAMLPAPARVLLGKRR